MKIFFVCGELSSILLFNFVQNFINCMRAIATKSLKKIFAYGELSSILLFNCIQNFINCMRAIATKSVKKISPASSFRQSCFSIAFKISLIACVRLRQSLKKIFVCGELWSILLFNFVQNFINSMRAIATKSVKKFSSAASFRQSCFSLFFKISLVICVRL